MSATLKGSDEDNVLTLLCTSDQYAPSLVVDLTPQLFSTRAYRKIAEEAFKYIEKYGRAPGIHLRDILEPDLRRGDDGIFLGRLLDDIDALAPQLQPDYVLSKLANFITLRKIAMAVEAAADAVHRGDIDAAQEAMMTPDIGVSTSKGIWLSDPDAMLSFLNQREEDFFPSGIDVLDARGVRPNRKQVFLIIGNKKIGKSWWLVQVGKQAIMHRKRVLHITLEMSEEYVAQRYIQALFAMISGSSGTVRVPIFKKDQLGRCTNIDFDTLTPDILDGTARASVTKKLLALRSRAPMKIKEFPMSSLTMPQLIAYLDALARIDNFVPDLLILDYVGIMALDPRNLRIALGQTFRQLRGLATARNMAVVTAWQGNRDTDNARTVTTGMIAEDYSAGGTADTICTISRTASERKIGLARVLVDAARSVRDKFVVMISQSYDTGQFCIDSVYMNKHIDEEVKRINGEDHGDGEDTD